MPRALCGIVRTHGLPAPPREGGNRALRGDLPQKPHVPRRRPGGDRGDAAISELFVLARGYAKSEMEVLRGRFQTIVLSVEHRTGWISARCGRPRRTQIVGWRRTDRPPHDAGPEGSRRP